MVPADEHRSLASLHHGIQRCRKCRLCETRRHAVPGEGPDDADLVLIGEAPGETEDAEGRPFRGRAGRYLDELLDDAGLEREKIYITSSVKCRPPANRNPQSDELETCRNAWLDRQVAAVQPRLIVLLGGIALRQLLGEQRPLGEVHGRARRHDGCAVLPTYHPAAGMRFPDVDEKMREDFARIRSILAEQLE